MRVIYADVYFIVNFSMDFLALFVVCKLRKIPPKLLSLSFAGALGALYAVAELYFDGRGGAISFLLSVAIPFLMCYIAYGYGRAAYYLINILSFWAVSFVMGGVMTALYYFVGKFLASKEIYINGVSYTLYSDIPLWVFILCAAACAALAVLWNRIALKKTSVREVDFSLEDNGVSIREKALCDSGNLLTEPISGLPVIIVSNEIMEKIAPGLDKLAFDVNYKKIRIIPYSTISDSGILYGYIPDCVKIGDDIKKACLCSGKHIGKSFDRYNVIVPSSLL